MKKLRDFTLTNEEWNCVKRCYLEFYKEKNSCDNVCPMGFDNITHKFTKKQSKLISQINIKKGRIINSMCVCHQFEEFKDSKYDCPCYVLEEKAFIQLEKFVKRECLNEKTS